MTYGKRDVHISKALTNFAIKAIQDGSNFIGDQVAPKVNVQKMADKYFQFSRGNWRTTEDLRTSGNASNRSVSPSLSTDAYLIEQRALHDIVANDEIDEADSPLEPKQDCVSDLMEQLMINKEKRIADTVMVTASVADYTSLAAASQWGYTSTTTPIEDMDTRFDAIAKNIGKPANQVTMGKDVFTVLKNHSDILDRIKYTQRGVVTEDLLAAVLDVDKVLVGKAVYMTTAEGIASESTSFIWGKNVLIQHTAPRPAKRVISHAYQFYKNSGEMVVKDIEDIKNDGRYIEVQHWVSEPKVVSTLAGSIIFGAVA
jgi:hypothetical protein